MARLFLFFSAWIGVSSVLAETRQLVPLEHFAALPQFSTPVLSPDGERIASTVTHQGRPLLVVQAIEPKEGQEAEKMTPINAGESFFSWYQWGNDERLIYGLRGTTKMLGGLWNLVRMGSIHRDGKVGLQFKMTPNQWGIYRQHVEVIDPLEHESDYILAALDDDQTSWAAPEVHLVNIKTGERKRVLRNRLGVQRWLADSNGVVRVGVKIDTRSHFDSVTIFYRDKDGLDWEKLQKINYFDHERLIPQRFDKNDPNILLVSSSALGEDTEDRTPQLYRYDLTSREILGPHEDVKEKRIIAMVREAIPDRQMNVVSRDKNRNHYIFRGFSDVHTPQYFFFDVVERSLKVMGAEYPRLDNALLSPMEKVTYTARDRLEIPAFLTVPKGLERKNLPLVVYPHGGPWAHDTWGFDNYVQFFASRGYAVFQPQFRGSTGYGVDHREAGYGQWGYTIQDDITDGVRWLVEQGIANPDRICIVGSSFGGYAAAMGAAKTPELYRCAVSINGVLNFKEFLSSHRKLLFSSINRAVTKGDGDPNQASPYHMTQNITAPLLLIASELDTRVPVSHSREMYKKLKRVKKSVTYVELEGGEHWRTNEANEIQKLAAVEEFLAEHLAQP